MDTTTTKWLVESSHISVTGVHTLDRCKTLKGVLHAISLETGEYLSPQMKQIAKACCKARATYGRQLIGTHGSFKYFVTSLKKSEEEFFAYRL